MFADLMTTRDGLRTGSRFHDLTSDRMRSVDLLLLASMGAIAAMAAAWWDFNLRIPGHAIMRTVLPLAVGLALVPRRGSGLLMSTSAGLTLAGFGGAGWSGAGLGALTSLLATGPLLDVAARWSQRGWQIYLAFAAAGLTSNSLAFLLRGAAKVGGGGGGGLGGGRTLEQWWPQAMISYAVCGLLAGLLGAAVCFRAKAAHPRDQATQP